MAVRLAGVIAFNLAVLLLYPTVIAPLFNKFTPLADAELRRRVEGLLPRAASAPRACS